MELMLWPEKNTPPNLGEPVEPLPEFPEFLDLVPTGKYSIYIQQNNMAVRHRIKQN